MQQTHVMRWLEHVRLRATGEGDERKSIPGGSAGAGKGRTVRAGGAGGTRCYVSISKRSASSPGAACNRYHTHERTADGMERERDGVEFLRDDGIDEWRGDRWSIIISPSDQTSIDLATLADRFLEALEARFGALQGAVWLHHDSDKRDAQGKPGRDHLHIAVEAAAQGRWSDSRHPEGGPPGRFVAQVPRILLTQRSVEQALNRALRTMDRSRGISR